MKYQVKTGEVDQFEIKSEHKTLVAACRKAMKYCCAFVTDKETDKVLSYEDMQYAAWQRLNPTNPKWR